MQPTRADFYPGNSSGITESFIQVGIHSLRTPRLRSYIYFSQLSNRNDYDFQTIRRKRNCTGFSLFEALLVLFVIGLISAVGVGYYSNATHEARRRTTSESLSVFFAACKQRAVLRRIPTRVIANDLGLSIEGNDRPSCQIRGITRDSCEALTGTTFTASQTLDGTGKSLDKIEVAVRFNENSSEKIVLNPREL